MLKVNYYQSAKILFLCTLLLSIEHVFAASPFISDDPDSLPRNAGEFYIFSAYNKISQNAGIAFPGLEVDYGITDDLEIDATLSYVFNYPHQTAEPNTSGMADTQLEIKYRFIHETENRPEIAFAPVYYAATGNTNRDLGNGRPWVQLPFWLQKSWGTWTTYGGGGYAYNSEPSTKNFFFGGWVLQKDLNDKWTVGGEIFSAGAASQSIKSYTLINLGGSYHLSKKFSILFSAGQNILGQTNKTGYLSLLWNF